MEIKERLSGHVPFDLFEGVILLEVYLWAKRENIKNTLASKIASSLLRRFAIRRGYCIDDSFRSPSGILNRLRCISFYYEKNNSFSVPSTQVFRDVITMMREEKGKYDEILKQVNSVISAEDWKEAGIMRDSTEFKDSTNNLLLVEDSIQESYQTGFRFDETVISLLEKRTGIHIDNSIIEKLKERMFRRNDELFFFPESICNTDQKGLLSKERILAEIDNQGCITVNRLFEVYQSFGQNVAIRDESDFEDFLLFLIPKEIKVRSAYKNRVIRKRGMSNDEAISIATQKVVERIKEEGCITEEDLLSEFSGFSVSFLDEILSKLSDEVIKVYINDYLCYQSLDSIALDKELISKEISAVINDVESCSLVPTEEILNALLSVRIGYNFREEYGILDSNSFQHIILKYYSDDKKRYWKAGCFIEVGVENV